ncbi:nucleotidyltransferase [Flavobacterium facile]|uniref:nucleotidyltransferase n=1 Tax=Flavobacterium facile TaxID=2893174 RepID=UPI002E7910AA|nr:nucleotidyltransferase [Flavobacterium sp. T-12]
MARSINEIQAQILNEIASNENLQDLNSTSRVSIYRLIIFIVSFAIWSLEKLFDIHSAQIDTAINEQKAGRPNDYKNAALNFQYGFPLLPDSIEFDNTGYTPEEIEASKIIKYCSVKESSQSARLIIKTAGEVGGELQELTPEQESAFIAYMEDWFKWAGVKLSIVNYPADELKIIMQVFRNPLVIDANGQSILDGDRPVELRINQYLKQLDFNGELVINDLIERLRELPGVDNVNILSMNSKAYNEIDFTNISVSKTPEAGYFKITDFTNITYVV